MSNSAVSIMPWRIRVAAARSNATPVPMPRRRTVEAILPELGEVEASIGPKAPGLACSRFVAHFLKAARSWPGSTQLVDRRRDLPVALDPAMVLPPSWRPPREKEESCEQK